MPAISVDIDLPGDDDFADVVPGEGLPLADAGLDPGLTDVFEGAGRMFHRLQERFNALEFSWDEFAGAVNGACEFLSEVSGHDIHVVQVNSDVTALVTVQILLDAKYLVATMQIPHHSIMKAPMRPSEYGGQPRG